MPLVVKHFDLVCGVDIHITNFPPPPAGPGPLPLPYPFMAMVFDPMDYVPFFGATVQVNMMKRGNATSQGMLTVPPLKHIPYGLGFLLMAMMGNDQKLFFGGARTSAEGSFLSAGPYMVMSCNDIGAPLSIKPGKNWKPIPSLYMPVSSTIPIPGGMPVNLNDPLVPDLASALKGLAMSMAFGYALKAAGSLAQAAIKRLNHALQGVAGSNPISRFLCKHGLEPVDFVRGNTVSFVTDFEIPGIIPLKWERQYNSNSIFTGLLGSRWNTQYDQYFKYFPQEANMHWLTDDGRTLVIPDFPIGEKIFVKSERKTFYHVKDGVSYFDHKSRLTYTFAQITHTPFLYKLSRIENKAGFAIIFEYDSNGFLKKIIDTASRVYNIVCNEKGFVQEIKVERPQGSLLLVAYEQDKNNDLIKISDALGKATTVKYNNHLMVEKTDKNGDTFYWEYEGNDVNAKCVKTYGKDNLMLGHLQYITGKTIVLDANGSEWQYIHQNGLVIEEIDPLGGSKKKRYNAAMELLSESDELGRTTTYVYDLDGNIISISKPGGSTISVTYKDGLPTTIVNASGSLQYFEYNEAGDLITQVLPNKEVNHYTYERGLKKSFIDKNGVEYFFKYDSQNNVVEIKDSKDYVEKWEYDFMGNIVQVTNPGGGIEEYSYDILLRPNKIKSIDGNIFSVEYDGYDNATKVNDLLTGVELLYNPLGALVKRRQKNGETTFTYDKDNRLRSVTNEAGKHYLFKYDAANYVTEESGFDGITHKYIRNEAHEVVTTVNPSGNLTQYKYDNGGRLVEVTYHDGTCETYGYDKEGNLTSAVNEYAEVAWTRDNAGRIINESCNGIEILKSFNTKGDLVKLESSTGFSIAYETNPFSLTESLLATTDKATWLSKIKKDVQGFEVERHIPGDLTMHWERDTNGKPFAQKLVKNETVLIDRNYHFSIGNRLNSVSNNITGASLQYSYDEIGNLTQQQGSGYGRDMECVNRFADHVGNYYEKEDLSDCKYGPSGQLLLKKGVSYEYDKEGRLISKKGKNTWLYDYYASGMLKRILTPYGKEVSFTYDAIGRRISKTLDNKTTYWVWNGNVPIHEWTVNNEPTKKVLKEENELQYPQAPADMISWIFEKNSFTPCAKIQNGQSFSIIADHLGTPFEMYDEQGKRVWEAVLDIYGRSYVILGKKEDVPFRYQGQYEDIETGLYYNRFRYYSPDDGIYISQDPIKLAGANPSLYGYVKDSNSWVDLFGLECKVKIKAGDGSTHDIVAEIRRSDFGEAAQHLDDIANGNIYTINRSLADSNRKASLRGFPTKSGFDRDEVPMAMFSEGGSGASVRYINPSDNRAAGSAIGNALKDYPDNTRVLFKIID